MLSRYRVLIPTSSFSGKHPPVQPVPFPASCLLLLLLYLEGSLFSVFLWQNNTNRAYDLPSHGLLPRYLVPDRSSFFVEWALNSFRKLLVMTVIFMPLLYQWVYFARPIITLAYRSHLLLAFLPQPVKHPLTLGKLASKEEASR